MILCIVMYIAGLAESYIIRMRNSSVPCIHQIKHHILISIEVDVYFLVAASLSMYGTVVIR